jgi:hypothetical protein
MQWQIFGLSSTNCGKFPQLVKSLVWAAKKYAPLTLSGMVTDKEGSKMAMKPTATLPVLIKYWLPFSRKVSAGKKAIEWLICVHQDDHWNANDQANETIFGSCQ